MVAMMNMLQNLSVKEKEAIMEVLSRDRRLRETEEERVMRLRIELARERRAGSVISQNEKTQQKRTCARCRQSLGFTGKARCPICNHIICKSCRVTRVSSSNRMSEHRHSYPTNGPMNNYITAATPPSRVSEEGSSAYENQNRQDSLVLTSTPRVPCVRFSVSPGTSGAESRSTHGQVSHDTNSEMSVGVSTGDSFGALVRSRGQTRRLKNQGTQTDERAASHVLTNLKNQENLGEGAIKYDGQYILDASNDENTHESSVPCSDSTSGKKRPGTRKLTFAQDSSSEFNEHDAVSFLKEMALTKHAQDTNQTKLEEHLISTANSAKIVKDSVNDEVLSRDSQGDIGLESRSAAATTQMVSQTSNESVPENVEHTTKQEIGSKQTQSSVRTSLNPVAERTKEMTGSNDVLAAIGKMFNFDMFKKTFFRTPLALFPNPDSSKNRGDSVKSQDIQKSPTPASVAGDNTTDVSINTTPDSGNDIAVSVDNEMETTSTKKFLQGGEGNQDASARFSTDDIIDSSQISPISQHSYKSLPMADSSSLLVSESHSSQSTVLPREASSSVYEDKATSCWSDDEYSLTEDHTYLNSYPQINGGLQNTTTKEYSSPRRGKEQHHDNGTRRRVRKTWKQRMRAGKVNHRRHIRSSSDGDEPSEFQHSRIPRSPLVDFHARTHDYSHITRTSHTNVMRFQTPGISNLTTSTGNVSVTNPVSDAWLGSRRKSFGSGLLSKLKARMISKIEDEPWVCKVCAKSLDLNKKSGDWFYKNARAEVLQFKEKLVQQENVSDENSPVPFLNRDVAEVSSAISSDVESKSNLDNLKETTGRARSHTVETLMLPHTTSEDQGLGSEQQAWLKRRRLRLSRKSVAEVLHGSLLIHIPDREGSNHAPPFVKKQSSITMVPATILDKPGDLTLLRGSAIELKCAFEGTPPIKAVWRKGKNEIQCDVRCSIDCDDKSANLSIKNSNRDDSGCYILQIRNAGGVDQYSVNVSIVDVPDPPGKPHASDINGTSLVVSWYGTGYDGGSTVTCYKVEMADVHDSTENPQWCTVASAKSTSCTVNSVKPNSKYLFRVRAENKHGISEPGEISDVVFNTVTEVCDSSDEEEHYVERDTVVIRADGNFAHKYETKERLGQGRFGKVHRVVDRTTGKEYAAKIMRALKAKDKDAVKQEIDIMNNLRHPRLVQLVDAYSQGREITMVMDLVSGGELFERVIDEDFELTEAACIKYMRQICDGLKYMHDAFILHLDLKPENIMCINKTGTQIKIIDFGLARQYNPKEIIRVMFGTPEFVAPEVINYDAIGPQTDMWSVGVICYILLSGLSPFMGDNDAETLSNITAAEWDFEDEAFDEISHDAKDFIRQLLVKNLNKRFTVHKALEHKWLKKDTKNMSKSKLNTKNLKRFLARRKWQKTGNAVRALGRLASLANFGSGSKSNKTANGQGKESGFLAALKSQLLRENDVAQGETANCEPSFETLFDDVEVIEGSAARFECVIKGTPDPEIMWYKEGQPIKESRHMRISYTEDDVCTLVILDATAADEAEYTCKAINCEGEIEHTAELIVITPGI